MILDSSFLIDLMESNEAAVTMATEIERLDVVQRVPAQVVYELYVGVGYTDRTDEEIAKIDRVVTARPIIETTTGIAKLAGRLDGQLRREGNRVAVGDVLIGATARHYDEPVVTGNPADFEVIPGVEVSSYHDR